MDMPYCTRRSAHGGASIDILGVPNARAWAMRASGHWHPALSDHCVCNLGVQAHGRQLASRACTPAVLRRLPASAWRDLRCRYAALERRFGIPDQDVALALPGALLPCPLPGASVVG